MKWVERKRERGRENERAAQPGGGCAWFWWWGLPSLKGRSSSSQCFHWFWLTASQVLVSLVWSASSPPSGRGDEFQELMPNQGGRSVSLLLPGTRFSSSALTGPCGGLSQRRTSTFISKLLLQALIRHLFCLTSNRKRQSFKSREKTSVKITFQK